VKKKPTLLANTLRNVDSLSVYGEGVARERKWNSGGYDEIITDRWLYAVAAPNELNVKIGMVLDEDRLARRLTELRRKHRQQDLMMIAQSRVPNVNHEETEHIEYAVRLWLTRAHRFSFMGKVDWLTAPPNFPQDRLQDVLDEAVQNAITFGSIPF
jgi:2-succinyl-5-enolpyruvyl-6-hydroxy-3-cyclohexene-1-carboxylate synthase